MTSTSDLTQGSIRAQFIALALPLLLGNILQQLYNTVDAMIIGRFVNQTAFAAIGVAGSVMNLFIFLLGGACNGISVIFAQLYGGRRWDELRRESFLSLTFGVVLSLVLSAVGAAVLPWLLPLIQTPPEVASYVQTYLLIIFAGLPATFLYNWCSAVLRAAGNTATALWVLAVAIALNTTLDVALVAVCRWGIAGAAAATVAAQLFAALVCLVYMRRKYPRLLFGRRDMVFDGALLARTANYGIVSALQQSSLYIGKLLVQGAVNSAGTDVIAAFTAATRVEGFANSFGDSGCAAMSVFIAQNRGAGENKRLKKGFFQGLGMMIALGLTLSALMALGGGGAAALLAGDASAAVTESAAGYMRVIAIFYVLCFVGNSFVGLFRGLGMVYVTVLGTTLQISIRAALSYVLIGSLGLRAVAVATGVGWIAIILFQITVYRLRVIRRIG